MRVASTNSGRCHESHHISMRETVSFTQMK